MFNKILLLAALLLPFSGWQTKTRKPENLLPENMKAIVENIRVLDSVPSGSGLVKTGENYYLISDDSPYFFKLNSEFKVLEKNAIPHYQKTTVYRLGVELITTFALPFEVASVILLAALVGAAYVSTGNNNRKA